MEPPQPPGQWPPPAPNPHAPYRQPPYQQQAYQQAPPPPGVYPATASSDYRDFQGTSLFSARPPGAARVGSFKYYVKVVCCMAVGLTLAGLLMAFANENIDQTSAEVCAEHGMVVRGNDYQTKNPTPYNIRCAPAGRWDEEQTFPYPQGIFSGTGTVFPMIGLFAFGVLGSWWLISYVVMKRSGAQPAAITDAR